MLKQLFSRKDIDEAVQRLAAAIERDFDNEEIIFICLLKGSFIFTSDLVRHIHNPSVIDFMRVSSYGKGMQSKGAITITKDLEENIQGKNVIIVEDIIDSGLTLKYIYDMLIAKEPKTLKICALVDKRERRTIEIKADYVGFTIDSGFIVGYGIDYAEKYRNLPDIYIIEE